MTIDDVTRDQWGRLAECAIDLLDMARMCYWLNAGEADNDPSFRNAMNAMAGILAEIGLPPPPYEDWVKSLEEVLRSRPEDFVKRI